MAEAREVLIQSSQGWGVGWVGGVSLWLLYVHMLNKNEMCVCVDLTIIFRSKLLSVVINIASFCGPLF